MQITDQIYTVTVIMITQHSLDLYFAKKNINQPKIVSWSQQSSNLVRLAYWLVMDVCSEDFFSYQQTQHITGGCKMIISRVMVCLLSKSTYSAILLGKYKSEIVDTFMVKNNANSYFFVNQLIHY